MGLILVSGSACSGKTTLARALEAKFGVARVSVEDYRAKVYARDGFQNSAEKDICKGKAQEEVYNKVADLLKSGMTVIVDHCFGNRDKEGLASVVGDFGVDMLILRLHCAPEVGYKRYLDRRKDFETAKARYSHVYPPRKPSDVDDVWKFAEFKESIPEGCDTFSFGDAKVVDIDTSGVVFEVHEQAMRVVGRWLSGGQAEV